MDVSKDSLEVADAGGELRRTFKNGLTGLNQFVRWVRKRFEDRDVLVVLEPTNTYHQLPVLRFKEAGVGHVLVSPLRARRYAASTGLRAKTDRIDAQVLARMGEREGLAPSQPPDGAQERMKGLRRHREWLEEQAQSVRNRLEAAERSPWTTAGVLRGLKKLIRDFEGQAAKAEGELERLVKEDKTLSSNVELLRTIPAVGLKTALLVLSELPKPEECQDSRTWPVFCGVTPNTVQSGKKHYGVLSRAGRPDLRAHLYMPAMVAMRANPAVAAYAARLAGRGKTGKRAILAAMHKLLRICFGVLKTGRPFDPQLHLNYS
jgi:transposase